MKTLLSLILVAVVGHLAVDVAIYRDAGGLTFKAPTAPDLFSTLPGHVVAASDPEKPEQTVAWYFDGSDRFVSRTLEIRAEGGRVAHYADIATTSTAGHRLKGILRAEYAELGGQKILTALSGIDLKFIENEKVKPEDAALAPTAPAPVEKSPITSAGLLPKK